MSWASPGCPAKAANPEEGAAPAHGQQLGVEQSWDDPADGVDGGGFGEQFRQRRTEIEGSFGELVRAGGRFTGRLGTLTLGGHEQMGLGHLVGVLRQAQPLVLVVRCLALPEPLHQQPDHAQFGGVVDEGLLLLRVRVQVEEETAEALRPQQR
ncbi:hypothetical protein ACIQM3_09290 [Streptomyces sp. NPDC091271]|uniref:hypothetical protein n=1 Tax=Streptomyces sp. NPDC091271 TaxID=3365980 RepID=UPI003815D5FB